ncbi:oxysterol-binding protein-related protein 2A-like isoform X3 [Typha angustifolia]|uniref:oxysterol-binding protein-related protein 2A-like isoform X3 n=1 Tax=Typha angustifolia TaxID=59011 RepID=UPI003C2FE416
MPAREMHPLCCIALDCHGVGWRSPEQEARPEMPPAPANGGDVSVAGVLYKWTNYGRGWRSRWFCLRNGVISYSKIRRIAPAPEGPATGDVRIIGGASSRLVGGGRRSPEPNGVVRLKVSAFRESKSDDRRFYVFSPTKTLHLRTDSKDDRVAWIEALISARSVHSLRSLSERISLIPNDLSYSTERLRNRMHLEGLSETLIKECEQIMLSEFSDYNKQLKLRFEEHINFFEVFTFVQDVNVEDGTAMRGRRLQLMRDEFSSSAHAKFSEYSTTESSDDVEKQEADELSDEDQPSFYDAMECFADTSDMNAETECKVRDMFPHIERRNKLPEPHEKEKGVSLWSVIKDSVGKDLTRVCLPVYFNEPLSSLQKCFEDLEYSYLLDEAYQFGKMGNSLMRILKVAAFAVSGYASSDGRPCKPFNPLLGETYEADFPEKGIRFFSEKVSHHPMLIACHCEGKGWKMWGDSNLKSKFWGQSIQLDPVGVLTLEFDDGEIFQWSKVTTSIYNLILGKVYCNHHGTMHIKGNRQYSCNLKFKEHSFLDRSPRQVQGFVEDLIGNKVASLIGKWNDSMYYTSVDDISKPKNHNPMQGASLLWKRNNPPANPTRYNLSSFAITLNELTSELQVKLPPTDSRLRPDQRHLENGEYEKANAEKLRLEKRQRMSRQLQQNGWQPRWFQKDSEEGTYRYIGGYWEAREQSKWDGCPNIFGEVLDNVNAAPH